VTSTLPLLSTPDEVIDWINSPSRAEWHRELPGGGCSCDPEWPWSDDYSHEVHVRAVFVDDLLRVLASDTSGAEPDGSFRTWSVAEVLTDAERIDGILREEMDRYEENCTCRGE
jgi:hypothetical protein